MKKTIVMVMLAAVIGFVATPGWAGAVTNPGFEDGWPAGWSEGGTSSDRVSTQYNSGSYSVEIPADGTNSYIYQWIDAKANTEYTFSAYFKSANLTGGAGGYGMMYLDFANSSYNVLAGNYDDGQMTDTNWTKHVIAQTSPNNTAYIRIRNRVVGNVSGGAGWYDDISVRANVSNRGFETDADSDGWADNWARSSSTSCTRDTQAHGETYSAKIVADGGNHYVSQWIVAEANTEYTLSGYFKSANLDGTSGYGMMYLDFANSSYTVVDGNYNDGQMRDTDWTEHTITQTSTADTAYIRVRGRVVGNVTDGVGWYDDFNLVPEPATMTFLLLGLPFALRRRR